jgi:hypothetical protein
MMPVRVLIAVVVVLLVCLLAAAVDRAIKVIGRERRRLEASRRLAAAAEQAEARDRQRKAADRASGALTSVIPTIHDIDIRHVDEPGIPPRPDVTPPSRVGHGLGSRRRSRSALLEVPLRPRRTPVTVVTRDPGPPPRPARRIRRDCPSHVVPAA